MEDVIAGGRRVGVGGEGNVDPGLINPCFVIWGCPWFVLGIITFGGEHPHINKQGFINPGSTLVSLVGQELGSVA